jgi:hypothetical protein
MSMCISSSCHFLEDKQVGKGNGHGERQLGGHKPRLFETGRASLTLRPKAACCRTLSEAD